MKLNSDNIGDLYKHWFSKSILEPSLIDFKDSKSFAEIIKNFQNDYFRYFNSNEIVKENILSRIELVGILLYRTAHHYFLSGNEEWSAQYCNLGRIITGFEIYYSAEIGEGMKINHGLGTVIGARCKIGKNVLIHQNVTLGDKNNKRPVIKDNVTIYSGAKILGGIVIGENAVIAANAVCISDVPDNTVAVGIPAKIIFKK